VTKSGYDSNANPPANDLSVAASTGIITVARGTGSSGIDTLTTDPTIYLMTANVDDGGLTSADIVITIEVINNNFKPIIVGKAGNLNIDENSPAGSAIQGGTVDCTDSEVDVVCDSASDAACAAGHGTKALCDPISECIWQANSCKCRRQQLEFFAKLNTIPGLGKTVSTLVVLLIPLPM